MKTALRSLLIRDRTFTVIALITLALTIGANSAIFSVINSVLLQPLPYPDPDRIVMLYNTYPGVGVDKGANGSLDYLDRRELTDHFEDLTLIAFGSAAIGLDGAPERFPVQRTTPELFSLLRAQPMLGRTYTEEELEPGKDQVAVVTHELWQRALGGDSDAIGETIHLDGIAFQVIGVMPPGFDPLERQSQVFMPLTLGPQQRSEDARHSNFAAMLARLPDGVTVEQAQARIDSLNRGITETLAFKEMLENARFRTLVVPFHDEMVSEVRATLYLLQAGVLFVLLIGCVNVANLMLVRSSRRARELAVRFAIGAGRWQVARQLLTESVALAVAGGLLGLLLAAGGTQALPLFGIDQLPRGEQVSLDWTVVAFTFVVALGAGLLFGLLPIGQLWRRDLADVFRQHNRGGSGNRAAALTRSTLVVVQLSLAFVLLAGAALMIFSFQAVTEVDPGFETAGVLTGRIDLARGLYPEAEDLAGFHQRLLPELQTIPGVTHVSLTSMLPFSGESNASVVTIEGYQLGPGESPPVPHYNSVSGDYFATMGIELMDGRNFELTDSAGEGVPGVVIVDQNLAERYWPEGSPLGKRLRPGIGDGDGGDTPWLTIVGVVSAVRSTDLADPDRVGTVYFPLAQRPQRALGLVVRTEGDPTALTAAVRRALVGVDPQLPLYDIETLASRVSESLVLRRAPMALLLLFALVALLLSAVGIYGVLAYSVSQRRREIGIRTALGARPQTILEMIMRQGLVLTGIGLGLGGAGAIAASRLLKTLVYGVEATNPMTFLLTALLLGAVAVAACLAPSLRASRVDPVTVLREE